MTDDPVSHLYNQLELYAVKRALSDSDKKSMELVLKKNIQIALMELWGEGGADDEYRRFAIDFTITGGKEYFEVCGNAWNQTVVEFEECRSTSGGGSSERKRGRFLEKAIELVVLPFIAKN